MHYAKESDGGRRNTYVRRIEGRTKVEERGP
jgi:hypothetical protein